MCVLCVYVHLDISDFPPFLCLHVHRFGGRFDKTARTGAIHSFSQFIQSFSSEPTGTRSASGLFLS